MSVDTNVLL